MAKSFHWTWWNCIECIHRLSVSIIFWFRINDSKHFLWGIIFYCKIATPPDGHYTQYGTHFGNFWIICLKSKIIETLMRWVHWRKTKIIFSWHSNWKMVLPIRVKSNLETHWLLLARFVESLISVTAPLSEK